MTENEISKVIVEAAIEVHRTLGGPGLLEGVFMLCALAALRLCVKFLYQQVYNTTHNSIRIHLSHHCF